MTDRKMQIEEEAIGWVVRLRGATAEDWDRFTDWLEADAAHAAAYEEAALADEALGDLAGPDPLVVPRPLPQAPDRRWGTRRMFVGWGIAAAIAGVIGYGAMQPSQDLYAVETGAGQRQTVQLADGSRIDLNGGTRLTLDRANARFARLERGEALFTVVHDDQRPFEVEAGGALLRDMGTVFNVESRDGVMEVGVAEGAVLFNPDREAVNLTPGMTLRAARGEAVVSRAQPDAITGWREGRLTYASAPVADVAADLSRNLGVPVAAAGEIAARPFTGVIRLDRQPEQDVRRAALLMGVGARRTEQGWILTESR